MEELKKFYEAERSKILKGNRACYIIGLVLVLIFGIIAFFTKQFMVLFFGFFTLIIMVIVAGNNSKKFSNTIKLKIVAGMVKQELGENAVYDPLGGINLGVLNRLGIYKHPDRFKLEDFISAEYNSVPYQICDAVFEERHVSYDSKGNRRVTYVKYFSGRIVRVDFKRNLDFVLKVVEGRPNGLVTSGLEKFETEVIDFNKKYNCYVSSQEKGFYVLTPVMIQKMLEVEKLYKGTIQFCIDGDCFYLFINNNTDNLEFSARKKLDEKTLEIIRSQINFGAAVVNEFGLDEAKFNENFDI